MILFQIKNLIKHCKENLLRIYPKVLYLFYFMSKLTILNNSPEDSFTLVPMTH